MPPAKHVLQIGSEFANQPIGSDQWTGYTVAETRLGGHHGNEVRHAQARWR